MDGFLNELQQWGPDSGRVATPREGRAYCRRLALGHYENFSVVSWFLPRALQPHFFHVYAFCRWADDLGDELGNAGRSLELLAWWRMQVEECWLGEARHPVFVALRETVAELGLSRAPFLDLISAFEQDQTVVEYRDKAQLLNYCQRSANPVGRIVLALCGRDDPRLHEWSDAICTGLQLANFWQDVARDWDKGRIYLPLEDRERFGYSREEFQLRRSTPAFVELMAYEVAEARAYLMQGMPLAAAMPGALQVDIELFARGGLKILDKIEAIGYRVWEQRPVVGKGDALGLIVAALGNRFRRSLWGMDSGGRHDHH